MVFNLRVLIFISSIVLMLSAIGSDSTENKPRPHLTEPRPHLTEPRPQSKKPRLYHQLQTQGECELVSIPMCQRLGYNLTATPNAFLHSTQHEAALEVHQFWPLLQLRCSEELRFFLCASYAPVCVPQLGGRTLPVCRQVCRRVRTKCEPFMKQHSFRWPQRLECSLLPRYGDNINREQLCVDNRNGASETVSKLNRSPEYEFSCLCKNACQSHPLDNLNMDILNQNQTCRKECYSALFSSRKRSKAVNLTMSFAVISGVTSLFTIVTFLLNRDRYQYPQRPIVFMAVNQMIVTVAYALRALAGHANVLCPHKSEPLSTTESPLCLATFALTQYGSTGVHVWWLIASMCWLAATTFQWAQEAISRYCRLMHTVGVAIPAIYTGLALVAANKIDWDTLLGMCVLNSDDIFINNNNKRYYLLNKFLWISPQLISVPVGGAFMLAALISMRSFSTSLNVPVVSSVRNNTLNVSLENSRRLRGLSRRLAVFVTLYVATSSIQLACTVIEHLRMFCTCSANSYQSAFIYAVLISQHVSKLAVGPVCATWMASRKTIRLWWYFLCCQQHKEAPGMQERVVVGERLLPVVPPGGKENPAQRLSVTDSPVTSHTSRHTLRTSSHKVNSRCSRQVFGNL